jgi:hypothetical protein
VHKKIFATLDIKNSRACLMLAEIDQSVFSAYDKSVMYPVPINGAYKEQHLLN